MEVPQEIPNNKEEKLKLLTGQFSKNLDKQFGANTLMRLGKRVGIPVPSVSTGLAALDYEVIGCGGLPKGRILEVYGPESAGKTSLMLKFVSQIQKNGGVCAMVDAEHAFDPSWAAKLGVDVDDLLVNQPDCAEEALQITEALIRSRACDMVFVDSVAALAPRAELDGEVGDAHVGIIARMMGQMLRMITAAAAQSGTVVVFVNQIREKIGVMYGNPETTPGGRALKFWASVRLDVRRKEWIKAGDSVIGSNIKVKAVKNKVATPFKESEVQLHFIDDDAKAMSIGFDEVGSTIDLGIRRTVIGQSGANYSLNGEKIAYGRDALVEAVRKDKALFNRINDLLRDSISAKTAEPTEEKPVTKKK